MSSVKVIASSTGLNDMKDMSAEDIIVYAARVSSPENQCNFATGSKLLNYCLKNGHFSIFETASLTIEVNTSRAIADQLLRHKSFQFQMASQRYSESSKNVMVEARRQDLKNRQNSIDDMSGDTKEWFKEAQQNVWDLSYSLYQKAIHKGIAKECARFLLPLSTATTLYMTGNFRSWYHYVELRVSNGTQKEHRDIAIAVKQEIINNFPVLAAAFRWESTQVSCSDSAQ